MLRFTGRWTVYLVLSLIASVALAVAAALRWSPVQAQTPSNDATLSALTLTPRDIIGFPPTRRLYEVGVDSTVETATVTVTTNDRGATVVYSPVGADHNTEEYDVDLSPGRNQMFVTVTAEDGISRQNYVIDINRGVTGIRGWRAGADLDGLKSVDNADPVGIWSDETTVWVTDNEKSKLFAYTLSDGLPDDTKDITLAVGNNNPQGIWSNRTTLWVADWDDEKLFACTLADQTRDADKDIDLHADNQPRGIWSDETTVWVVDAEERKLYAYNMPFDLALEVTPSPVSVDEGSTATLDVRLSHRPSGIVTVSVSSDDEGAVSVDPASLTFNTLNWDDFKEVTVTGEEDADQSNEDATVSLDASRGGYDDVSASVTVRVRDESDGEDAPEFADGDATTRSFEETFGDAAVTAATDIGGPVSATDDPGDTLTYTLEGTDAPRFDVVSTSGQLQTRAGEKYYHERQRIYEVTVVVEDDDDNSDTIAVTLIVTDRDEPPLPPTAVNLSQTSGSASSLNVSWHPPDNPGRPDAVSYDLRYRRDGTANYTNGPQNVSGPRTAIGGLRPATTYHVQVRATNHEGDSGWTAAVTSTTAENSDPVRPSRSHGLVATGVSESRINLSWNAPFDDGGASVTGYKIEVSETRGSGWSDLVANTRSSCRSYAHTGLAAGVTRYYRVFAINRAGEGRSSPVVSSQTQATGAKPKRPGVMYLYFTASDRDRNESPEATSDGNRIKGDCSGQKYFRAYWTEPNSPPVNEWEVRIESSNGASASAIQVRYRNDNPEDPEFTGRALFATAAGESCATSFAVRGRYGNTWGEWGPMSTLSCKNDE